MVMSGNPALYMFEIFTHGLVVLTVVSWVLVGATYYKNWMNR